MNVFEDGSDLSDIESNASPPATPGNAITPRTSPQHRARESSQSFPIASSSSSGRKVAGPPDYKVHGKRGKRKSEGIDNDKEEDGKSKKKKAKMDKVKSVSKRAGKEVQSPQGVDVITVSEIAPQSEATTMTPVAKVVKSKKPTNMKGYAYVTEEEVKKPDEENTVEGKRTRKPIAPFTVTSKTSSKRGRESASVDTSASTSMQTKNSAEESNELATSGAQKPKLKIRLNMDSKPKPKAAQDLGPSNVTSPPSGDAIAESEMSDPPLIDDKEDVYEEEEEEIQRPRKRQRDTNRMSRDDDEEEEEEDVGPRKVKSKVSTMGKKPKKDRGEKMWRKSKSKIISDEESADDFKDAKISEDEAMSDAADDEGFESDVKTGSRVVIKSAKAKSRGDFNSNLGKKSEPRKSTGSATLKTTVAGLINTYTPKVPAAASSPKPAIVKAAVRKVPSMNLFDNIMGFGGGSKQSTPAKVANTKAPRSSLSGLSTPQSDSPMVKGSSTGTKKDGEGEAASTTASRLSSLTGRASPMSSNGRSGRMVTVKAQGANGEHVTAAEMAKRKEVELYRNAHPKGLFNLLEGAEIMMQFEDDTRRLLEFDPLIARTKLYRASRTEGLPKLIERIKEDERKKREATLALTPAVNVEPITSN